MLSARSCGPTPSSNTAMTSSACSGRPCPRSAVTCSTATGSQPNDADVEQDADPAREGQDRRVAHGPHDPGGAARLPQPSGGTPDPQDAEGEEPLVLPRTSDVEPCK